VLAHWQLHELALLKMNNMLQLQLPSLELIPAESVGKFADGISCQLEQGRYIWARANSKKLSFPSGVNFYFDIDEFPWSRLHSI
jgi:hypothetical protein